MSWKELTIRNRREEFHRVVEAVDDLAADCRLSVEVARDMQVALDEVLTNIVSYAYSDDSDHDIRVCLRVLDNMIEAVIEDDGAPFNPLTSVGPSTGVPLRERRMGGLGLHFVKSLMSESGYDRVEGRNRLVFRRRLSEVRGE